ncbi:MAG: lipopolysaccharide biosynthesis protein [Bacteroidaceae bacterium]|nr:lipopolysaccharide biosynthesis protein [Bacteroidaceae bacterium]
MTAIDQRRIAVNTLLLYLRMGLVLVVNLYVSRVVLDSLGKVDYGIYSAVAAIVVMFSFMNSTMSTACQRFFSFELGRKDYGALRTRFTQSLIVFFLIALVVVALSETVGLWFLNTRMKLEGRDDAAHWVFQLSVVAFVFQIMRTPYMGMIIAREKMKVFAYISVFEAFGSLAVALSLRFSNGDRMVLYAMLILMIHALTTMFYLVYCRLFYAECKIERHIDKSSLWQIFRFTGWEMIGSLAGTCKAYGINPILLNPFFGPEMNAAMTVSQKVYMTVVRFQNDYFMAVKPQIIKSYASGAVSEMIGLLFLGTRFSYFLILVLTMPLFFETPAILDWWLKAENVPEMAVTFTKLLLVNSLVDTLSNPLASAIQATGKNKWYQICMGLTLLAILPVGYVGYKVFRLPVESVFYISIGLSVAAQCMRLYFVKRQVGMDIGRFLKEVIWVMVLVTVVALAVPAGVQACFGTDRQAWQSVTVIVISVLWTGTVAYFIGITRSERSMINGFIVNLFKSVLCRR